MKISLILIALLAANILTAQDTLENRTFSVVPSVITQMNYLFPKERMVLTFSGINLKITDSTTILAHSKPYNYKFTGAYGGDNFELTFGCGYSPSKKGVVEPFIGLFYVGETDFGNSRVKLGLELSEIGQEFNFMNSTKFPLPNSSSSQVLNATLRTEAILLSPTLNLDMPLRKRFGIRVSTAYAFQIGGDKTKVHLETTDESLDFDLCNTPSFTLKSSLKNSNVFCNSLYKNCFRFSIGLYLDLVKWKIYP